MKATTTHYDETFLSRCNQQQLETLLREFEARLGTGEERPGDMDAVRAIAHRLNNLLTFQALLGSLPDPAGEAARPFVTGPRREGTGRRFKPRNEAEPAAG